MSGADQEWVMVGLELEFGVEKAEGGHCQGGLWVGCPRQGMLVGCIRNMEGFNAAVLFTTQGSLRDTARVLLGCFPLEGSIAAVV